MSSYSQTTNGKIKMKNLTPSDIEFLIHCHCCPEKHERIDAPAIKEATERFLKLKIIEYKENCALSFNTTDKGKKLIEMLCETPFPVEEIILVDPRFEHK